VGRSVVSFALFRARTSNIGWIESDEIIQKSTSDSLWLRNKSMLQHIFVLERVRMMLIALFLNS